MYKYVYIYEHVQDNGYTFKLSLIRANQLFYYFIYLYIYTLKS